VYEAAIDAFHRPGECKDKKIECQRFMKEFKSNALGNSEKLNSYCGKAMEFCERTMVDPSAAIPM
jgi:hypothetical protein